jgi:hypothetical protein
MIVPRSCSDGIKVADAPGLLAKLKAGLLTKSGADSDCDTHKESREIRLPPEVWTEFINLTSKDAILSFACRYGNLHSNTEIGETLSMWQREIEYLWLLCELWMETEKPNPNTSTLERHLTALGRLAWEGELFEQPSKKTDAGMLVLPPPPVRLPSLAGGAECARNVVRDAIDRHLRLFCVFEQGEVKPEALLDFIWLQFGEFVRGKGKLKVCEGGCGRVLAAQRSTKHFCDKCGSKSRKQRQRAGADR